MESVLNVNTKYSYILTELGDVAVDVVVGLAPVERRRRLTPEAVHRRHDDPSAVPVTSGDLCGQRTEPRCLTKSR